MRGWRLVGLELWMFALALIATASAQGQEEAWIGKIVSVQGQVLAKRQGETQWQPVHLNDTYGVEESLHVGSDSRAAVVLKNGTLLRLDQNTTILFKGMEEEKTSLLEMLKGAGHFFSRQPRSLKIITPFVNGVVKGTEFFVRVDPDQTFISLFDGRVLADNSRGSVLVAKGQSAVARADQPPRLEVVVRPRDAVQWSLYYPPILAFNADDFAGTSADDWQAKVRRSILAVGQGDLEKAFTVIASLGPGIDDPDFFTYRAGLNLVVGRTSDAQADIAQALVLEPDNSRALALRAIMAVVQNRKEDALADANRAVTADPDSAAARIALSYAQQARFDLNAARGQALAATQKSPQNAVAWARLAELQLCTGELDEALSAAQKATRLNPHLAHAQTVLGYAHLIQIKIDNAKEAFDQAIELDQAAPLPRLGLGLAKIRQGDLKDGRAEIEIAAGLDPDNSLLRSYLGKAYYEEKRTDLDEREYAIAKELDPNDPTPYFYDAIRKQTINRPVEALHDLQKAIELNDNRAVYRSKLLLDEDEASRSASLARIYSNLGFQQRALVEGWQSVNTDPTNYSAHRFLADSYAIRPRHEIARVSELLQSQLLQPLNITPIQPQLAESNLFLINAGGPAGLSFNEYNPIFNRNRFALQGSGFAVENDSYGGEGVISGIYNRFSFSGGYTHFETDGWRDNSDQDDNITSIFGQYQLSHKTSIQAEYRYRDTKRGDVRQTFFDDDISTNLRQEDEIQAVRVGLHHIFSIGSDLIGDFQYTEADRSNRDSDPELTRFDIEGEESAYGSEIEYLWRSEKLNIITGVGYFNLKRENKRFIDFYGFPVDRRTIDRDATHSNIYLYSNIKMMSNLTATVGGSGDFFDPDNKNIQKEREQFNPKFGINWNPLTNTTIRGAAFRVLKRTLITDQTIEPTHVAGFNQFFDELNGTDYWIYGGAIDQKFNQNLYAGAEYTHRDLERPYLDGDELKVVDWDENIFRTYFFWTPQKWLSFSAEYQYEGLLRDEDAAMGAKNVDTHLFPLGINFFHYSGMSASLIGTYVNQDGRFDRKDTPGVFSDGDEEFFLIDATIRYRLPKRYGFLTFGVKNLADKNFEYFESDSDNPRFLPDRLFYGKVTITLP